MREGLTKDVGNIKIPVVFSRPLSALVCPSFKGYESLKNFWTRLLGIPLLCFCINNFLRVAVASTACYFQSHGLSAISPYKIKP